MDDARARKKYSEIFYIGNKTVENVMWRMWTEKKNNNNNKKNNYKRWKEYLKKHIQQDESKEVAVE